MNLSIYCAQLQLGHRPPFTTTKETRKEYCTTISRDIIPKTLQDAIHVTKELVIRFIWIYALCIIQDDARDLHEQAGKMDEISQHSFLNLSATPTTHLGSGFL